MTRRTHGAWRLSVLALLPLLLAAAEPSETFRERAVAYARESGPTLIVDWVSRAQLDEDGAPEPVARLCDTGHPHEWFYLVELDPGVQWIVVSPERLGGACPSAPPPAASPSPLPTSLTLRQDVGVMREVAELAFRGGQPILMSLASGRQVVRDYDDDGEDVLKEGWRPEQEENWATLTFRSYEGEGALIPVLDTSKAAAGLPRTFNAVVHGREVWKGETDAAVRVAALALGQDRVRLRIDVKDDATIAASPELDDKELLGTDHLELWWATAPAGRSGGVRQLAVARTAKGTVFARWLHPAGLSEPPPAVALEGRTVLVDLPLASFGLAEPWPEEWEAALSVVYSDADEPGRGQQTLVATSLLRWGKVDSFARLVSFAGHTRYPSPTYSQARFPGEEEPAYPVKSPEEDTPAPEPVEEGPCDALARYVENPRPGTEPPFSPECVSRMRFEVSDPLAARLEEWAWGGAARGANATQLQQATFALNYLCWIHRAKPDVYVLALDAVEADRPIAPETLQCCMRMLLEKTEGKGPRLDAFLAQQALQPAGTPGKVAVHPVLRMPDPGCSYALSNGGWFTWSRMLLRVHERARAQNAEGVEELRQRLCELDSSLAECRDGPRRWVDVDAWAKEFRFLWPYLLGCVLFIVAVTLTSRSVASRVFLAVGALLTALMVSLVLGLSIGGREGEGAVKGLGLVFFGPLWALVLVPLLIGGALWLTRGEGRRARISVACGLVVLFLRALTWF